MATIEKLKNSNHLFAFINHLNRNIIRERNKESLFRHACQLAIDSGQFKIAWIGLFENKKIFNVDQNGIFTEDIHYLIQADKLYKQVLQTGKCYISNDIGSATEPIVWRQLAAKYKVHSHIILPIKESGTIIGTFNLFSSEYGFFEKEETDLLLSLSDDISLALDLILESKRHKEVENLLAKNERQFRHTLDNMLEGVQIQDYSWKYIYVNDALVKHSNYTREELLGHTMFEKYPGIENSNLFKIMSDCMVNRKPAQFLNEFTYPDKTKRYFELSIHPIPEGLFIMSVDITEQRRASEKLDKANRLYKFISAINQSIVHTDNQHDLFNNACNIALEIGKFKMAWIGLLDENEILKMETFCGNANDAKKILKFEGLDINNPHYQHVPSVKVIKTGKYFVNNEVQNDPNLATWKDEFVRQGIFASISLPIVIFGKVTGIIGFHSGTENFFDEEEIALLEEATGDISFALENFEKAKKHWEAENLIINNEKRFRALIEKSADMKTLAKSNWQMIYCSPSVTKVLGYKTDELLNTKIFNFVHPNDIASYTLKRNEILNFPGESFSFQQRLLHKNGNYIWCEGTVTNLLLEPGIEALVANFRDISQKKIAEEKIEFDKNNLHALINNTNDFMWSIDLNFKLITYNIPFGQIIKSITGAEAEKGLNVLQIGYKKDQMLRIKNYYERAFAGEIFTETEHSTISGNWQEISFFPIWQGEEVIGTACHSRNITERKNIEQQLRNSEIFNRGVLNSLSAHISVIDYSGRIVATNEAWKKFALENGKTTMERSEEGSNYLDICSQEAILGDEIAQKVLQGMKDIMDDKTKIFYLEYPCYSQIKEYWFALRVKRFDTHEMMIVASHQDITERKLAEEAIINKNVELQKTNAELDRFVYSASHDLRSPLTSILGLVSIIETDSKEADTLEYNRLIKTSVQRLDEFIRNILNYSRNNRTLIEAERIPLEKTVRDIIGSLCNMKESAEIEFIVNINEEEPFYSSIPRLNTILENIISNAIKYHKQGDFTGKYIKVSGRTDYQYLYLEIEDNGVGIDPQYHEKIFDMFFRLPGKMAGSGIGLYIVKEIVEKLQGSIQVVSKESVGTTFILQIKNMAGDL